MARTAMLVFIFLFTGVVVCPSAFAANETAQTGTIEVEIVYADTGERVPVAFVEVEGGGERFVDFMLDGRIDVPVKAVAAETTFTVTVGNFAPTVAYMKVHRASFFVDDGTGIARTVTLTPETPKASVRVEVERGWELSGTVRRQDGSPLPNGLVMVEQGTSREEWAYAFTESDGTFRMLGIIPTERVRVRVESVIEFVQYRPAGLAPLSVEAIELDGEKTAIDLTVETASLYLVVDYEQPVWPLKNAKPTFVPAIAIWIDADPDDGPEAAEVVLDYTGAYVTMPRRTALVFRSDRYERLIRDLPAGRTVTLGIGIKDVKHDEPYNPTAGCTFRTYRTATVEVPTRTVHVRVYAPGARESQLAVVGGATLVVLVVTGAIVVRAVRLGKSDRITG